MDLPGDRAHPFLLQRRSVRAIDAGAPVDAAALARILDAARWAPSSGNGQPWRYVVCDDRAADVRDAVRATLTPGNAWAMVAPVLLVSCACTVRADGVTRNRWAEHDVGAASVSAAYQAAAEGLVFHQMGGFDAPALREALELPDGVDPMAVIAVGVPLDPALAAPEIAERDARPRTRLEVREVTWHGRFGSAGWQP